MATMNVLDAAGSPVAIEKPLAPGRVAATASRPVALSNEDLAAINALHTDLVALEGYVDGLEALIGATNTKMDTLNTAVASTFTLPATCFSRRRQSPASRAPTTFAHC
jgi:hypothetical protein